MTNESLYIIDNFSVSEAKFCEVKECKKLMTVDNKTLSILTQNVRSINHNINGFEVLLRGLDMSCDILNFNKKMLAFKSNFIHTMSRRIRVSQKVYKH